ncbi:MAG: DUF493 domain-containing protein [Gammaproteobacteria bacterium]|nr:DUF493 domain-containing protein [Gammaproteobacteria bacterium]
MSDPVVPDDLFGFPCDFPIKVMGRDTPEFRSITRSIVEKHSAPLAADAITERPSGKGTFIGVTYTIRAESRAQLDAIYMDLTSSGVVLVAL